MRNKINISSADLRDFLKASGWKLNRRALDENLYALENTSFPRRQFVFPIQNTAPDFNESIRSVINKYADLTGESSPSIVSKVIAVRDDVVRFRVYSERDETTLPLNFASNLVKGVEKFIKAAACTVLRPRVIHPRLSYSEATDIVGHS